MSQKLLLAIPLLLALAACQQPAQPPAATTEPAPATQPMPRTPEPTTLTMPESFELPFAYKRLNENSAKSNDGKIQHRSFVEFLDTDAANVEQSLTAALEAKGFGVPAAQDAEGERVLTFTREDGATVVAKINGKLKGTKKAPNAKGTVHITWTAG